MEKLAEEDKPKKEEVIEQIPTSKDKFNKPTKRGGKETQSQSQTKK